MRLAISNIAWAPDQDDAVAAILRAEGVTGVELAPTTLWSDPWRSTRAERAAVREAWGARGLQIVALQSLLFGHPHLQLLDPATVDEVRERLVGMVELAAALGAGRLVLGSPKNRLRGARTWAEALGLAVPVLARIGAEAERHHVALCIEPNPPCYGCDFVTTAAEGRAIVERVGSPGFRLHLDAAGMRLAGDEAAREIALAAPMLGHFHMSAPDLGPVGPDSPVDASAALQALRAAGYDGWVSIEMRRDPVPEESLRRVSAAVRHCRAALLATNAGARTS